MVVDVIDNSPWVLKHGQYTKTALLADNFGFIPVCLYRKNHEAIDEATLNISQLYLSKESIERARLEERQYYDDYFRRKGITF